jgi:hypothetical protein
MEDFGQDASQGADLLGLALGQGLPGVSGPDLDEFVDFEIFFDGTMRAAHAGTSVPYLRARLCDTFEVFGAAGLEKYLWHCDRFVLEECLGDGPDDEPHLTGHLRTGDGAEDEWYVAYLLKHLTLARSDVSCRIIDADGELLIIEAALAVPRWLTPENAEHRCWLRNGKVHILPKPQPPEPQHIACTDALARLRNAGDATVAKDKVQVAINSRLEGYPKRAMDLSRQVAKAALPGTVARLLVAFPQLVAVAVNNLPPPATQELTRLRRQITGEASRVKFDCECIAAQDMACVGIRFTRCQYARVMGLRSQLPQRFTQKNWQSTKGGDDKSMRIGAMLCAGLEAAFLQGAQSATAALRWPSSKFNDAFLSSDPPWYRDRAFTQHASAIEPALSGKSCLVRRAFEQQRNLDEAFRPALMQALNSDIVKSIDLAAYWCDQDDKDDWLQISSEELDQEMQRRQEEFDAYDRKRSAPHNKGDIAAKAEAVSSSAVPEELRKELASMGREISGLLEKQSCLEGVEAATTAASSPAPKGEGRDGDSDSEESELDVLGMEDEAQEEDDDEDDDDMSGEQWSAEEMHKYMEALDEQLEEQEEHEGSCTEGDVVPGQSAEEGFPLGSHHIKVDSSQAVELDLHAMEHLLASYCAEHHFEPGPASLLLGELGLAGGSSHGQMCNAESLNSMD